MTCLGRPEPRRKGGDAILALSLLALGGIASGLSPETQQRVETVVRNTALAPFLQLHRRSAERTRVGRRATVLEAERDSLAAVAGRYRMLADQANELRELAGLAMPEFGSVVAAQVYPGRPRVGDPDVFVLRGPALEDLAYPVGVFTGSGLVGVARASWGGDARGEFWSHPDFRVSAMTEDGSVSGIVRPVRPKRGQPVLELEGAPFQSDVPDGTRLVTTGIGGVYPPGIPIGTVRGLAASEAGWMKSYFVEPAVRPAETSVVLLWKRPVLDAPAAPAGPDAMETAPDGEPSR